MPRNGRSLAIQIQNSVRVRFGNCTLRLMSDLRFERRGLLTTQNFRWHARAEKIVEFELNQS
jgi:hypothetical protein